MISKSIRKQIFLLALFSFVLTGCSGISIFTYKEAPKPSTINTASEGSIEESNLFKAILGTSENRDVSKSNINNTELLEQERIIVEVIKVIDSDTIKYYDSDLGQEVTARLIGINGPEFTKTKQLYGKESTEYLMQLINGKDIEIEFDPNADLTDKYGRNLVHAFLNGESIQEMLLRKGLVRVAYLYGDYKYIDKYKAAELKAKNERLNIWSIEGYVDNKNGFNMNVINN